MNTKESDKCIAFEEQERTGRKYRADTQTTPSEFCSAILSFFNSFFTGNRFELAMNFILNY